MVDLVFAMVDFGFVFVVSKKIRQKVRIEENLSTGGASPLSNPDVSPSALLHTTNSTVNHHGEFSSLCGAGSWGSCFMQRIR